MFQLYGIPAAPSIFEGEALPRPVYVSHTRYHEGERTRAIHSHVDITEVLLIYHGTGLHQVDDHVYHSRPGDLIINNVGTLHNDFAQTEEGVEYLCLGMTGLRLLGLPAGWLAENEWQIHLQSGAHFDALHEMLELMERTLHGNEAYCGELARHLTAAFAVLVRSIAVNAPAGADGGVDSKSALVHKMLRFIDRHYTENFTLDELAEAAGVSRYYASRLFRQQTGSSPTGYRLQRRIGEAQSLLTDTDYSITYIAGAVGYDNPNHFTQRFTEMIGVSPREFRKRSVKSKVAARRR
ncbi:AraC family transcriptional regulator [Agathobaculum sp. NTUH-O15-33]|uniref:AraC family transcriptional regulator n=1 Tax=Agathobaculum sp. NTUH-O15-33 TaxID=3079302 RepID=UPI002958CE31|nr:AraC family transcriptional regulator [Agathobaculum sp. NTUH-O15-33]WNX84535.1 AraC family transcriptional regulator [Agathobaculum sp. NTUH-O15-33]